MSAMHRHPSKDSMNKQDLIRQIQESRSALKVLWSRASEQQMSEIPGPQPGWTVKAFIAHLTYWEHATLDRLNGRVLEESWGDVDKINAELLVKAQARSIDEILREFNESGRQIIREIELLTGTSAARSMERWTYLGRAFSG
jgi:hypothetical protein